MGEILYGSLFFFIYLISSGWSYLISSLVPWAVSKLLRGRGNEFGAITGIQDDRVNRPWLR